MSVAQRLRSALEEQIRRNQDLSERVLRSEDAARQQLDELVAEHEERIREAQVRLDMLADERDRLRDALERRSSELLENSIRSKSFVVQLCAKQVLRRSPLACTALNKHARAINRTEHA